MSYINPIAAFALSSSLFAGVVAAPQPVVLISTFDMPSTVPINYFDVNASDEAVALYRSLRNDFSVSHTVFANWLGVKRRTMYNWLNDPSSSKQYGSQIERRLDNLKFLKDEMEPEHREYLQKIAFSPIYGDKAFGQLILDGASSAALTTLYDDNFSRFEDYRVSKS
jgi:hypothetical protein